MIVTGELPSNPIEQVALDAQGACKTSSRSGWKLGRLMLTDERFILVAGRQVVIEVPLDAISQVNTERRAFVLSRRPTIRLTCSAPRAKRAGPSTRRLWLITKDIQAWQDALFQMACLEVTDQAIQWIASAVDEDSATLLWHVWHQRHAGINELAELIDATCHDDVLEKIRKTINPAAAKLLGCGVLVFRRSWRVSSDSEPVTLHWWVAGRREPVPAKAAVHVSVFEEPEHVDVVTDLPGVRDSDVMLNVFDNRLILSAASDTEKFHEEMALPTGTRPETLTWRMNNGVLLVRFHRLSRGQTT